MSDRIALLRAILAHPGDNTPRLVFADWLEEYGDTEADRARVEFIRLWFGLRPGLRSTTKLIGQWLAKNWSRLCPGVADVANGTNSTVKTRGRSLSFHLHLGPILKSYFSGGFAERVQFSHGVWYERFWRPIAVEEPLATLGPDRAPPTTGALPGMRSMVHRNDWGPDIFDGLVQFDEQPDRDVKVYTTRDTPVSFVPYAAWHPSHRALEEITAAMTAIVRAASGLADTTAKVD